MSTAASSSGLDEVDAAINFGGAFYRDRAADFNAVSEHVVGLLDDAVCLYRRASFGAATFLAVTAMEETAKAVVALFRRDAPSGNAPPGPRRDPLRDHGRKHRMAVLPTVFMGSRLTEALGPETCERLRGDAESGGFIRLREAAIYFAAAGAGVVTPKDVVSRERAREILLLAIEVADDQLVGFTTRSFEVRERLDQLFADVLPQVCDQG